MRVHVLLMVALLACSGEPAPVCEDVVVETLVLRESHPRVVDLLLMVDDSNSTAGAQVRLGEQIPHLIRSLSSGDLDGDGTLEFEPVRTLHVGVINADMGSGGFTVPTCTSRLGDDGMLQSQGNVAITGCRATYPTFLEFRSEADDPDAFASDVLCVALLGSNGCGFEQQLESVLKAVTPSASSIAFLSGSGHADGANAGFLRDDSLLVILMLTDEDDCSASDSGIYEIESERFPGEPNLRCHDYPEALHPVERYVEGLLGTREDPRRLVYVALAGMPPELDSSSYEEILSHESMQNRIDPSMPTRLETSCNFPGTGIAFPPRRIVQVGAGLQAAGAFTLMRSQCRPDYSAAMADTLDTIVDALSTDECLNVALARNASGLTPCQYIEELPVGASCDEGREAVGVEMRPDGVHQVCRVRQLTPEESAGATPGWFYDDFSPDALRLCDHGRLGVRGLVAGTGVSLHCGEPDAAGVGGVCFSSSDCDGASDALRDVFPRGLVCDANSRCRPQCDSDDDCGAGFVCMEDRCALPECE